MTLRLFRAPQLKHFWRESVKFNFCSKKKWNSKTVQKIFQTRKKAPRNWYQFLTLMAQPWRILIWQPQKALATNHKRLTSSWNVPIQTAKRFVRVCVTHVIMPRESLNLPHPASTLISLTIRGASVKAATLRHTTRRYTKRGLWRRRRCEIV